MYLWLKAAHIIAMVAWFSGIFYLPRLFVYHAEVSVDDVVGYERFCTMERRLYRYIMHPAAGCTVLFGLAMLHLQPTLATQPWFLGKMILVFCTIFYHGLCGRYLRRFTARQRTPGSRFFRVMNELPVFLLIGAVILVVVRPGVY